MIENIVDKNANFIGLNPVTSEKLLFSVVS